MYKGVSSMHREIQDYLRASAASGRRVTRVGPFLATINGDNGNPWLNYAIPDDGAMPSAADVEALTAHYVAAGRLPRLEYISTAAPAVAPALLDRGYAIEHRLLLMVCRPADVAALQAPAGVTMTPALSPAEIAMVRAVQHDGYGETEAPTSAHIESLQGTIERGGGAMLAMFAGIPVGAGEYTPPQAELAEVTSVAVREPYRRRGIAGALVCALTADAFGSGARIAFLMADTVEARVYARAGYTAVGEVLTVSLT